MFIVDIVAIAVLSLLSMGVGNAWELVLLRFFIGVFVGADYPIATSLIAEFTLKEHRSISMGMVPAAWYLGATVAAFVGFGLCVVDGGWKIMLGSAIIPCVFCSLVDATSPSPRCGLRARAATRRHALSWTASLAATSSSRR